MRGGRVRVEQRLDGSMAVKFRQYRLSVAECQAQPKTLPSPKLVTGPRSRPKQAHNWMKDFHLQMSPPMGVILPRTTGSGSPTFFGG